MTVVTEREVWLVAIQQRLRAGFSVEHAIVAGDVVVDAYRKRFPGTGGFKPEPEHNATAEDFGPGNGR